MSNLKVAVRVRPMSDRELERKSVSSVSVENGVVSVTNIKVPEHHAGDSRERVRKFAFDYCFGHYSTQDEVFSVIEDEVSEALSHRYHACVLAYGQSSTGKTYTMMGLQDEPGLTPRLCENIFKYFQCSVTPDEIQELRTSVSYLEIYNERVQDLLTDRNNGRSLKVREHPKKGPYVQGLSEHQVHNSQDILRWLSSGNGNRRVAATSNNRRSSRSHSVFTVSCASGPNSCHRLHLVDLAGSERAYAVTGTSYSRNTSGTTTPRLKEGANINRSLVALGNVICALADQSGRVGKTVRKRFVPYRDSVLTWLLKETLGGNSKTVMIATISPSSASYSETVNTLRFGQRAKQIVNQPVVNEDAKERLIRELRAEIVRLKELLELQNVTSGQLEVSCNPCVEMTDSFPKENTSQQSDNLENSSDSDDLEPLDPVLNSNTSTEHQNITQKEEDKRVRSLEASDKNDDKPEEGSEKELEASLTASAQASPAEYTKTDTLIPVIDITSSVKPKQAKPTQLSRTYSVDYPKPDSGKLKKNYGSHEALQNTVTPTLPTLHKNRSAIKEYTENIPKSVKLSDILSKIDKPVDTSSRSGSISESSGKSTPKRQTANRRIHRRSEVVAAVTQRLYSQQVKKKDTSKTMEDKSGEVSGGIPLPRQNLCSSARIRLQDLTQRALKASKRKVHSETQTETSATVRLKEKSTDVQDIKVALLEVKDANVGGSVDVQNVGISCHVENYNQTIKLTRTCSSQTEEQKPQSVSFTKYLKDPPLAIHSYSQPIYTSSVNINVSHNYPFQKEEISDDSLEDLMQQNVQYSTPDLISNHNSLEQTTNQKQPLIEVQNNSTKSESPTSIADRPLENFCEYFAKDSAEFCTADGSIVSSTRETAKGVSVPVVCAAKISKFNEFNETCTSLNESKPVQVKSVHTFEAFKPAKPTYFLINRTRKLKPIIKPKVTREYSTEESDTDSSMSLSKKVRFSPQLKRKDMLGVLQNFMDEASSLIHKLNTVAKQIEQGEEKRNKRVLIVKQKVQDSFEELDVKECYVQTYLPHHDASSQTSSRIIDLGGTSSLLEISDSDVLENKWEQILKSSCDKLDQCVRLAEHKSREDKSREDERRKIHSLDAEYLHRFPQPFSCDADWKYSPNDYSSLETSHSASDYGSLPRRDGLFRRSPYRNYSPKAYMKQLVALRRQIVETSRHDLMEELRLPTSSNS